MLRLDETIDLVHQAKNMVSKRYENGLLRFANLVSPLPDYDVQEDRKKNIPKHWYKTCITALEDSLLQIGIFFFRSFKQTSVLFLDTFHWLNRF